MTPEMIDALERLLLCTSLDSKQHDLVELALDDGYESMNNFQKSQLRRLLNRQAARVLPPLQRYRLRRAQHATQATAAN